MPFMKTNKIGSIALIACLALAGCSSDAKDKAVTPRRVPSGIPAAAPGALGPGAAGLKVGKTAAPATGLPAPGDPFTIPDGGTPPKSLPPL